MSPKWPTAVMLNDVLYCGIVAVIELFANPIGFVVIAPKILNQVVK